MMKKFYSLFLSLIFLITASAQAQVAGITDLFGNYKFTADVEFTTAGNNYKGSLLSESDVIIRAGDEYCIAAIVGFAGSKSEHEINSIDTSANTFVINNPNNPQLWGDVVLANINGDNPYGVYDAEKGWVIPFYGSIVYSYDPITRVITVPDFSVVKVEDPKAEKATVIAKYTNVKITPTDTDAGNSFDWAGDYQFSSTVTSFSNDTYPSSFNVKVEENSGSYFVTEFMGNDISSINYGGIPIVPREGVAGAAIKAEGNLFMYGNGDAYIKMMDMNAQALDIKMSVNADGTISVDDFSLVYSAGGTNTTVALYQNVVLRKALPQGVKGYRLKEVNSGTYLHIKSYNANSGGATGSVIMSEKNESPDQIFILEDAGAGKKYLLSQSGYYIVCRSWNVDACNDGQKTPLTFEKTGAGEFYIVNSNGYFKVENVGGVVYPFCDANEQSLYAKWMLEEVGVETGILAVEQQGVASGIYDLSGRRLENVVAPGIYIIGGKKVFVK